MRKTAGVLMLISGVVSIYIMVFTIWKFHDSFFFSWSELFKFNVIDWIDIWIPIICGAISTVFITLGIIATWKRKRWWLAVIGSIFSILTPVVWQLFPVTREVAVVMVRGGGILIGVITVVFTLFSRGDFKRTTIAE
jgi:glucan phosphoethanolaminetransferase (alkaline phosphatase superfamily)